MNNKLKSQIRLQIPILYNKSNTKALLQKINTVSYLWRLEPKAVIRATWLGVAMVFIPIGFKSLITAILSKIFHANYFVALSISWLRNPLTIMPILYSEHYIGSQVINSKLAFNINKLNVDLLLTNWKSIVIPLIIGSAIVTTIATITIGSSVWITYHVINKFLKKK